jgi:predicted O-methyltransferase YrrM
MMTYDDLLERVRAFWPARIILTAVELGVAGALDGGARTAAEAARRLGTDPRATELLLNALTALGLVVKEGDRFANAPVAREHLVQGAPDCRVSGLMHQAHLWQSWSGLTQVVKTGRPALREAERSEEAYRDFIRAMHDFGRERAQVLAGALDLSGVRRLLDLGGGPGSYAIAFCARNPGMAAVVFDRPQALGVAREIVRTHGAEDRVDLQAGDFLADDLGAGYDLVLISQIIHSYDAAQNRLLLRKAAAALAPGGTLVLQDFLLDSGRCAPEQAALFAINMLVNTEGGRTYAWEEVEGWLGEVGFRRVERLAIPGPAGVLMAKGRA